MNRHIRTSESREKTAYKAAVRACLEAFYAKSPTQAESLVDDWWARLSATSAFQSGIFLHSEPINTAGRIAGKEIIEINANNEDAYEQLLKASARAARRAKDTRVSARKPAIRSMSKGSTRVAALSSTQAKSKAAPQKRLASAKA
jgi:hypothetical protein